MVILFTFLTSFYLRMLKIYIQYLLLQSELPEHRSHAKTIFFFEMELLRFSVAMIARNIYILGKDC